MRLTPAVLASLCLALTSCASYSQIMVAPDGHLERCTTTGQGIVGMATAAEVTNACVAGYRAVGYLEIERAGFIGVTLRPDASILQVWPGFPADSAGIEAGDQIVRVSGQKITSDHDAQILLFGIAGTQVDLTVARGEAETSYKLTRGPYYHKPKPKRDPKALDY